jgi:phosphoribosyl-AMP cyclohydrolase
MDALLDSLRFDDKGLIPAIIQDAGNGQVLMFAFMNRTSLQKTIETRLCHYWSRSRGKLWLKGESSGHTQKVLSIRTDCDQDVVLIEVEQQGVACHDGYRSCFYKRLENDTWQVQGKPDINPESIYGKKT